MSYIKENRAKFSSWIVKFNNSNINYNTVSNYNNNFPSNARASFSSIETLQDPFNQNISIDSSDDTKLLLPVGKYFLDLRLSIYNGNNINNYYYYFVSGISGWVSANNSEEWLGEAIISYYEEQTAWNDARNIRTYYESNNATDFIRCYTRRDWSGWGPGGTPQINVNGSSDFSTSTNFPTGESRLLVMRIE